MEHEVKLMDAESLVAAVTLRDLTAPDLGRHAMQLLMEGILARLRGAWGCQVVTHRCSPITSVQENYDRLHYPREGIARDARYTRYVSRDLLLRTHTTAMIPTVLRVLAGTRVDDVLIACPGLVYRRDCIDRIHTGEPHQLDLWRLWAGPVATPADLDDMVQRVVAASLPNAVQWRCVAAEHPYTVGGRQIDVRVGSQWVEIGECGVADPEILREAGLGSEVSGLAMGLGLDRLVMLRKGIDDIRLLRSTDPRVQSQLGDLSRYRPVSREPAVTRDMSLAVDGSVTAEELGDRVRAVLADDADYVEELVVVAETAYADLPSVAMARLGMSEQQKNVLLRLVIRHLDRSLTRKEANALRDRVYVALHQGAKLEMSVNPERA